MEEKTKLLLKNLYASGNWEELVQLLKEEITKNPQEETYYYVLGKIYYYELKKYGIGIWYFIQAAQKEPYGKASRELQKINVIQDYKGNQGISYMDVGEHAEDHIYPYIFGDELGLLEQEVEQHIWEVFHNKE